MADSDETISVVIADDETVVRDGLRMMLETQRDIEVVGVAADGDAALTECARRRPDVLLLDVRMPRRDGLSVLRELAQTDRIGPNRIRVVMLTTFDLQEYVDSALQAGASGFLLKSASHEELVAAVRAAADGEGALSPTVARRLITSYVATRQAQSVAPEDLALVRDLTDREREVLDLLGQGLNNAEIAARLTVSEHTVKTHVSRLLHKTGCRDRGQAAALARRLAPS